MNRSDIKKTPGRLVFAGISLYAKLGTAIEAKLISEMFPVGTDGHGELDQRQKEAYYRATITPDGRLDADIAAVLWPYGNPTIGTGIFSDADVPLVIHGQLAAAVDTETYGAAALEEMPALKFSSVETAIAAATFLCLRKNDTDWADANSLVTQADNGGSMADAGFAPSGIITQPYTAAWGNKAGFTDLDTMAGFNVEFQVAYSDDMTDRHGMLNRRLKTVSARVRCDPIGPTRQQILAALEIQGNGAGRGVSRQANAADLVITGDDGTDYFALKNAILTDKVQRWGTEQLRIGDVAWIATRTFAAGAPGPLFEILP
jgi:hypothetical protein